MTSNTILTGKQMYYTSCEFGLSGGKGFQTKAKSIDLNSEQQRNIEELGVYKPPRDLSDEPSRREISEEFPKLYRNVTLDSGDIVILRSEYMGTDYSGRWGNYFSHGLLLNALPEHIWPVDVYEWIGWKRSLTSEESVSSITELPDADIRNINNAFPLRDLQEFINEDNSPNRLMLPKIIQAVFLKSSTSKNIVIKVDLESDAIYWIACIQKCFPVSLQKHLNSSTYQFDPRTCLDINITFGETDLLLRETERDYQYYAFDFSTKKYTDINQVNEYAKTVASWLVNNPTRLIKFYQLCGYFNIEEIDNNLILLLQLFKISIGEENTNSQVNIVHIIRFVEGNINPNHYDDIAKIIDKIIKISNDDFIFLSHIASFYISASNINNNYAYYFLRLFPKLLLSWLVDQNQTDNTLMTINGKAKNSISNFERKYAESLLSEQNITELIKISSKINTVKLEFLIKEFGSSQRILKDLDNDSIYIRRIWSFLTPTIVSMSPKLNDLDWLLASSLNNTEVIKITLSRIVNIVKSTKEDDYASSIDSIAKYLNKIFNVRNSSYRYSILNALAVESILHPLITAEWNIYFNECKDKISCFSDYYSNFLQKNYKYLKNNKNIVTRVWKQVDQDDKQKFSIYLINNCINITPDDLYAELLLSASIAISLTDDGTDGLYDQLCGFRDRNKIEIYPDKLYLRQVIDDCYVPNSEKPPLRETIKKISVHLNNADESLYSNFLSEYFPLVMSTIQCKNQHGLIVKKLYIKNKAKYFINAYSLVFQSKDKFLTKSEVEGFSYWLGMDKLSTEYSMYKFINGYITELITSRLSFIDSSKRKKITNYFERKDLNLIHSTQKITWDTIINNANKKKSFLKRFWS